MGNFQIGNNYTRYCSEGLNALLAAVEKACVADSSIQTASGGRYYRSVRNKSGPSVEVDYWNGDPQEVRRWGGYSTRSQGPWFTSCFDSQGTDRLLILTPEKAVKSLGALEALAMSGTSAVMPEAMKIQVASLLSLRMGYYALEAHTEGGRKMTALLAGHPDILRVSVPVLKHLVDRKEKATPAERIRRLSDTFHTGAARRKLDDERRQVMYLLRDYDLSLPKLEEQRQRLLKAGGHADPLPSVIELLEKLLAEYRLQEERDG